MLRQSQEASAADAQQSPDMFLAALQFAGISVCGYVTHISSRMGGDTASGPGLPAEIVIFLRPLLAGGSNAEASQECI
jgi:hypothetical protein